MLACSSLNLSPPTTTEPSMAGEKHPHDSREEKCFRSQKFVPLQAHAMTH